LVGHFQFLSDDGAKRSVEPGGEVVKKAISDGVEFMLEKSSGRSSAGKTTFIVIAHCMIL
jgi:hypothetical protein